MACKQKLPQDADLQKNLDNLLEATSSIWGKISKNKVTIKGETRPINGRLEILFEDDRVSSTEKFILKSHVDTTRYIAGCQASRSKIGHILFGFRVVYGECLFVTVSPNRRHSALILRLSRARRNDSMLRSDDQSAQSRASMCGRKAPRFMTKHNVNEDLTGESARVEIPLPALLTRQALNAQDPLASVH